MSTFKFITNIDKINELLSVFKQPVINELNSYYVVYEEDGIKGIVNYNITLDEAEIYYIYAIDSNTGVGTKLMNYLISILEQQQVRNVFLEVNETNKQAIKFYNKFNFKIINERKNYYKDCSAFIMVRKIGD